MIYNMMDFDKKVNIKKPKLKCQIKLKVQSLKHLDFGFDL